ncbi:hypothetical protein JHK86_049430 [Glycine max]|nr:hypothetical protein JHK86_049430 [Glycine max]
MPQLHKSSEVRSTCRYIFSFFCEAFCFVNHPFGREIMETVLTVSIMDAQIILMEWSFLNTNCLPK